MIGLIKKEMNEFEKGCVHGAKMERERCFTLAWDYVIKATRKGSWSQKELKEALEPNLIC